MSVEEELKKDHAEMQAAVDSKQKIIDAQVGGSGFWSATGGKGPRRREVTLASPYPWSDPSAGAAEGQEDRVPALGSQT